MSLTALSLAAMTTAAASTAHVAIESLGRAGQSFASLFAAESNKAASQAGQTASVSEQLQEWSDKFREWLSSRDVTSPFEVKLGIDEAGYSQLEILGAQREKIEALLQESPQWKEQLDRLGRNAQALASTLYPTAVSLQVDDSESSIRYLP